jgi:hypothetical protein
VPRVSLLFVQKLVTPHGSLLLVQALQSSAIKADSKANSTQVHSLQDTSSQTDSTFSLSAFSDQRTKKAQEQDEYRMNIHLHLQKIPEIPIPILTPFITNPSSSVRIHHQTEQIHQSNKNQEQHRSSRIHHHPQSSTSQNSI